MFMAKIRVKTKAPGESKVSPGINTLEQLISNKQSPIDIREIAYSFMNKLGGTSGFVDKILQEYESCSPGTLARSRILDIMVKLFQIATPKEKFGDFDGVTDEDLMGIIQGKLNMTPVKESTQSKWVDHVCI